MKVQRSTFLGEVVPGKKIGRTIGFPTANIQVVKSNLALHRGVYGVFVKYRLEVYKGIMNIGTCPTFKGMSQGQTVEVHILDFDDNLYGEILTVHVGCTIRHEKAFSSINMLIDQLKKDEQFVREKFQALSEMDIGKQFDTQVDDLIQLPDLLFSQYCLNSFAINKGVYNTIESWFYKQGLSKIEERRAEILSFFHYLSHLYANEKKVQFGSGGLKAQLDHYWDRIQLKSSATS
jgi:riboflavin kinase